MIEKVKFINMVGPVDDVQRVKENYLSKYEIQLEEAAKEVNDPAHMKAFDQANPYAELLLKAEAYAEHIHLSDASPAQMSIEDAVNKINEMIARENEQLQRQQQFELDRKKYAAFIEQIKPFLDFDFKMSELFQLQFIHFRFGKMPRASYAQFSTYMFKQPDILFEVGLQDADYVWGIYLVPKPLREKVDRVFTSFHFEQIRISADISDTPRHAFNELREKLALIDNHIQKEKTDFIAYLIEKDEELAAALAVLSEADSLQKFRKYMVQTNERFYVLVGWMAARDAKKLEKDVQEDERVVLTVSDNASNKNCTPPTKLKNNALIRPFEFFVQMYGMPAHNEMDPTPFIALTYSCLFGMMFGDVGQGAVLSLVGFLLYKLKGFKLGAIMSIVGLFSVFFGFMYGSVFGFEDILTPVWMSPMHNMNAVLLIAVGIGVGLIIVAMGMNIINAIKQKDAGSALFSSNGLAGLVFYGTIIVSALLVLTGRSLPVLWLLIVLLAVPFLIIGLQEPLSNLIKKEKKLIHGTIGGYMVETFFELFEVLLSYMSNTISFVRVGAFALSHAGMMSVVLMLADAEKGNPNLLVMILGNLLVMCMEGLVVGIQVLRLEYYEMFSRFYRATGRAFVPFHARKTAAKSK